jgi:hypothetical protein
MGLCHHDQSISQFKSVKDFNLLGKALTSVKCAELLIIPVLQLCVLQDPHYSRRPNDKSCHIQICVV